MGYELKITDIKRMANNIKPSLKIGKNGLTDNTFLEIKNLFKKQEVIKIKFNIVKEKEELKDMAQKIADTTGSDLIDIRGFNFVLYKKFSKSL